MYPAKIAQLGERQTEELKVPSSILGLGMRLVDCGVPMHDAYPPSVAPSTVSHSFSVCVPSPAV